MRRHPIKPFVTFAASLRSKFLLAMRQSLMGLQKTKSGFSVRA